MTISSYAEFQQYLTGILTANIAPGGTTEQADAANAPHGQFWSNLTYDQFVNGDVPGVSDPNTGDPMPILVKGNAAGSNIIQALEGTPNSPFDPNTGAFGRMPADGGPFLTDEQIAPISDWINAGCPNGSTEDSSEGGEEGTSY